MVYYQGRIVLPRTSSWIPRLVHAIHASPAGGHEGAQKTLHRVAREFFWIGMRRDVARLVAECDTCQRNKYSNLSPAGLLQPLALPEQIWDDLTMDFIDGLPKSGGYTVILVVVDRLSKAAHFIPLKHPYTASSVATVFIREVIRLHGVPKSIVSDRDKVFLSKFWREIFKYQGTLLKRSTAYHPQTDGQTEVVNRSVETYLRCFASERPKDWLQWLPWAEYWYNTSHHSALGTTPFKVLYGRDPPRLMHYDKGTASTFEVDQYLLQRDRVLEELRRQLLRAQQIMKAKADVTRRDVTYEVGDWVFLKLRPYRQVTVAKRANQKLASRYFGPYEVMERIGPVAYRLKLPLTATIHPVFHVSQLKKVVGDRIVEKDLPQDYCGSETMHPREVRGTREVGTQREVLIAWEGGSDGEETWMPYEEIQSRFPDFHLEDKVVFRGGGDDANQWETNKENKGHWGLVYKRKATAQVQGA